MYVGDPLSYILTIFQAKLITGELNNSSKCYELMSFTMFALKLHLKLYRKWIYWNLIGSRSVLWRTCWQHEQPKIDNCGFPPQSSIDLTQSSPYSHRLVRSISNYITKGNKTAETLFRLSSGRKKCLIEFFIGNPTNINYPNLKYIFHHVTQFAFSRYNLK